MFSSRDLCQHRPASFISPVKQLLIGYTSQRLTDRREGILLAPEDLSEEDWPEGTRDLSHPWAVLKVTCTPLIPGIYCGDVSRSP